MLKLPRSKNGSPIPAYSQSTIRMRVAVVDEVGVEQVVVARPQLERVGQAGRSSIRRPIAGARSYSGGIGTPRATASARYASTIRSGMNRPGIAGPSWIAAERVGDAAERLRLVDRLVRDRRAHDEPGDEIALGPDERRHLRPDPDARRRDGRGVLDLAADPEQVGVVAGQPDDPAVGRARRPSTRKLRFVIPPDSAVRVSGAPGEVSGHGRSARTRSSRRSPRERAWSACRSARRPLRPAAGLSR